MCPFLIWLILIIWPFMEDKQNSFDYHLLIQHGYQCTGGLLPLVAAVVQEFNVFSHDYYRYSYVHASMYMPSVHGYDTHFRPETVIISEMLIILSSWWKLLEFLNAKLKKDPVWVDMYWDVSFTAVTVKCQQRKLPCCCCMTATGMQTHVELGLVRQIMKDQTWNSLPVRGGFP